MGLNIANVTEFGHKKGRACKQMCIFLLFEYQTLQ